MTNESVLAALRSALRAQPDDIDLGVHLAEQLVLAGEHEEALEVAGNVLAQRPDNLAALRAAATSSEATGRADQAAAYRRLIGALDPNAASPPTPEVVTEQPASPADPAPSPLAASIPDSVDDLITGWEGRAATPEPDIGHLQRPAITLADVGGLEQVKERIDQSFLIPIRNPELRFQFGKSLRGGLLLWGPPGCGKTYIARAIAGELGAGFYEVGIADVLEMWLGSSERNMHNVFQFARANTPCVLFFDELDALGHKRSSLGAGGSAMRGVINQLLTELDGATSDNEGIFVLAATNHPWDVDPALLRPGRIDRKLLVLPPDHAARVAILAAHLRGRPHGALDLDAIARITDGRTGADLSLVVEQAAEAALEASIARNQVQPIEQADLLRAATSTRPSIGSWSEMARNHAQFGDPAGEYAELLAYLDRQRRP